MSTWSDVATAVGKAAPIIGTVLGGPLGAAAGSLVASALGVGNDPDSVNSALVADPQAIEKIKEAELNAKVELQKLIVQAENNRLQAANAQYVAETQDRDSARQLAAKQPKDIMRPALGLGVVGCTVAVVIIIMVGGANSVIKDPVAAVTFGTIIGYLFGEAKSILGFYFGMTADSSKANADIRNFATAPGAVTTETGAPLKLPAEARDDLAKNWTK